jgi:hypothetical protein
VQRLPLDPKEIRAMEEHQSPSGIFLDTIEAVQLFFEDMGADPTKVYIWMDVFSMSQHASFSRSSSWYMNTFKEGINSIGNVLMVMSPWQNPRALQRAWCVLEAYHCVSTSKNFQATLTRDERHKFLEDIQDTSKLYRMLSSVSVKDSACSRESDRKMILEGVEQSVGYDALDRAVFVAMERFMLKSLDEAVRSAQATGDPVSVLKISFSAALLRCHLGISIDMETANEHFENICLTLGHSNPFILTAQAELAEM